MNQNMYIILAKRRHDLKAEIIGATPSLTRGENIVNELFNRNCLKLASLVYLSDGVYQERLSVVYKLETICNHPHVQGNFNFDAPEFPFFSCESCGRVITSVDKPILVSLNAMEKVGE